VAFVAVTLLQGVSLRHVVDPDEAHLDRMLLEVRRTMSLLIVDRLPPSIRDAVAGQMGGSLGAGLEGD
jgi:hypothetical protein